jgi:putative transposase
MPRPGRINHPNLIYHVINRGNNGQTLFADEHDFRHYLWLLQRYKKKFGFAMYCFCLMSNHVHLVIKTTEGGGISRIMNAVTVAYARYYHRQFNVTGHVWQGRFKSPLVSDDDYLLTVMRYIEQNPVRAGLVGNLAEYPFSSYRVHAKISEDEWGLVDTEENPIYMRFGATPAERASRYKKFADFLLDENKVLLIRRSLNEQVHFMSARFRASMIQSLAVHGRRGPGRPRKVINS